ncbi:MAG: hypothetical protein AAF657_01940 [Acidobacteriota bacterium]
MIAIESRRRKATTLAAEYPGCEILDLTSKADEPWIRFSPFFPHSEIPVPFSEGHQAASVEGIWQGLKVFADEGVDPAKFKVTSMKGIKRSVRTRGPVLGHQRGLSSSELLPYLDARRHIYLPSYRWVLDNCLRGELESLRAIVAKGGVVLLDYETNSDITNLSRPLSHASLVRAYLQNQWPDQGGELE